MYTISRRVKWFNGRRGYGFNTDVSSEQDPRKEAYRLAKAFVESGFKVPKDVFVMVWEGLGWPGIHNLKQKMARPGICVSFCMHSAVCGGPRSAKWLCRVCPNGNLGRDMAMVTGWCHLICMVATMIIYRNIYIYTPLFLYI